MLRAACNPWHARQLGQEFRTLSIARRRRSIGFPWPSAANTKIFSARHANTDGVRCASGTVFAASSRTPRNTGRGQIWDHSLFVSAISYSADRLLTNENLLLSFLRPRRSPKTGRRTRHSTAQFVRSDLDETKKYLGHRKPDILVISTRFAEAGNFPISIRSTGAICDAYPGASPLAGDFCNELGSG